MPPVVNDEEALEESSTSDQTDVSGEKSSPSQPEPNLDPSTFTPAQVRDWKNTGAVPFLPVKKVQEEDSNVGVVPESEAEETQPKESAGVSKEAKPASESAPVKQQQAHKGKNADSRKAELAAEIQDLLKQRNALKAEISAKPDVKVDLKEQPAESSPAPKIAKVELPEKPAKPSRPAFGQAGHENETYDAYEKRVEAWQEDWEKTLLGWQQSYNEASTKKILAEDRAAREKERLEAETAKANKAIEDSWSERVNAAKGNHEDYDEVVAPLLGKDSPITPSSVMDSFLLDSDVGAEMMYHFGNHPEEVKIIMGLPTLKAARALVAVESFIMHPPKEEEADLEPEPEAPKKQPVVHRPTKAQRPATEIAARNSAPVNELEAVVAADDFTRFKAIQDRKDVERRKRG